MLFGWLVGLVVILSEAKDLLSRELKESRSFASLRMTMFLCYKVFNHTYNPASIRDLGSSRSRNASPIKLNASTANITVTAGKSTR